MVIRPSGSTRGVHTINSTSSQEAINEDWALLSIATDGHKNPPRSVISPKTPGLPMNTRHTLKVMASAESISVSVKIDVVKCRVRVEPWIPISVNQTQSRAADEVDPNPSGFR